MKTLKYINTFMIVLLLISVSIKFIYKKAWMDVLTFLFIIGCFQVFSGIALFLLRPRSIRFRLYIGGLILHTLLCFLPFSNSWIILPIPLLLYYTFMIHTVHQKKHEYKTFKTSSL